MRISMAITALVQPEREVADRELLVIAAFVVPLFRSI